MSVWDDLRRELSAGNATPKPKIKLPQTVETVVVNKVQAPAPAVKETPKPPVESKPAVVETPVEKPVAKKAPKKAEEPKRFDLEHIKRPKYGVVHRKTFDNLTSASKAYRELLDEGDEDLVDAKIVEMVMVKKGELPYNPHTEYKNGSVTRYHTKIYIHHSDWPPFSERYSHYNVPGKKKKKKKS